MSELLRGIIIALWDFAVDAVYVALVILWGIAQFVAGMFTSPSSTLKYAVIGARAVSKDLIEIIGNWGAACALLYRKLTRGVPRPVRLLIILIGLSSAILLSNYLATASRRRVHKAALATMMRTADVDEYRRLVDEDIRTAAPAKKAARAKRAGFFEWLFGYQASSEKTPMETEGPVPKWTYDSDTGEWHWARSGKKSGAESREDSASAASSGSGDAEQAYQDTDSPPPRKRRRRVPVSDEDLDELIDRNTKADEEEEEHLKSKIERFKARDRLGELRIVVEELQQRRKLRQQMQNEYDWADELEARREVERERKRLQWQQEDLKWRRLRAAADEQMDDSKGVVVPPQGQGRESRCGEGPVRITKYTDFLENQVTQPDYAYVTYVSSAEYVQGAAVLMYSIALTGSQYARAVAVTADIGRHDRELLGLLAQVIEVERVAHPHHISNSHYIDTFTKLRIWQLAMYKKVVYIDVDVIVVKNLDDLFDLGQWSVPMDAEQSRYSTGMMVCEPSLSTFDDMIKKLQTTRVSMELPDLLFLKEYFDGLINQPSPRDTSENSYWRPPPPPAPRINIIPRWYQVYQEEFGSQYHTYLTARTQKITIYDTRIHGIHYPGNNKPWHNFKANWKQYASHLCHWKNNEAFYYDPKFLWYIHFAWLKAFLKQATSDVGFEFEKGAPVIKLSDWVSEQKRQLGYDQTGGDRPSLPAVYDQPLSNYQQGPQQANFFGALPSPPPRETPAVPAPQFGMGDWVPAQCEVRRPVYISDSADYHLILPTATRLHRRSAPRSLTLIDRAVTRSAVLPSGRQVGDSVDASTSETMRTVSGKISRRLLSLFSLIDQGDEESDEEDGIDAKNLDVAPTSPPTPSPDDAKVVVDLGTLDPVALRLPQEWEGMALEPYIWVVTWCSARKIHPSSESECGMPSYVAQYSGGLCRTNFAESLSLHLVLSPTLRGTGGPGSEVLGVVLRSSITLKYPPRRKFVEVVVRCDWSIESETDALLENSDRFARVFVDTVWRPHNRRYTIRLRSRCACAGGCGKAKSLLGNGDQQRDDSLKKKKELTGWIAKTFGSALTPFPSRSVFRRCFTFKEPRSCFEQTACHYESSRKRCQPTLKSRWVRFSSAEQGYYCNCTHVGGNAVEVVTLAQCQSKALSAGANVVNYGPWPHGSSPVPDTPPPAGVHRKIVSACYFKRCPDRVLWQGAPSTKRARADDESGFNVYFLNPFYVDEAV